VLIVTIKRDANLIEIGPGSTTLCVLKKDRTVTSPNEFWLTLHRLAESYEAEGLNSEQRLENIVERFQNMPRIAQRHVLGDLLRVITALPDVYPLVVAAMNDTEKPAAHVRTG
jgi:hypothetical protein